MPPFTADETTKDSFLHIQNITPTCSTFTDIKSSVGTSVSKWFTKLWVERIVLGLN